MAPVGFALIYLGAINAMLAIHAGTCTMAAADSLGGGVISFVLYGVGGACLWFGQPSRGSYLVLLPVIVPLGIQLNFTVRLAVGVWFFGETACSVMMGIPFEEDGREVFFAWLWIVTSLVLLVLLPAAYFKQSAGRRAG